MDDETRIFAGEAWRLSEGQFSGIAGRAVENAWLLLAGHPIVDTGQPWDEHLALQAAVALLVFGRDARGGMTTGLAIEGMFERAVAAIRDQRSKTQKQAEHYGCRREG